MITTFPRGQGILQRESNQNAQLHGRPGYELRLTPSAPWPPQQHLHPAEAKRGAIPPRSAALRRDDRFVLPGLCWGTLLRQQVLASLGRGDGALLAQSKQRFLPAAVFFTSLHAS